MKKISCINICSIALALLLLITSSGCLDINNILNTTNQSNHSNDSLELPPRTLNLSEIPVFSDETTLIAVQDNITFLNYMSALRLQNAFPEAPIKQYSEITEEDKNKSNIVVMGNRNSNAMFEDVYNLSQTTSEKREFQGEGNGSIEITTNPWNSQTNVLLVEGSDKWGVRAAAKFIEAGETGNLSGNYTEVDYQFTRSWTPELEEAAIEKAEEIFADETKHIYDSTVSEKTLNPLFYEYFEGYEVYSGRAELVEPPNILAPDFDDFTGVAIATSPDGKTFAMWRDFADLFEFEKPTVYNEMDAIEVASLYASSSGQILVNVSEIPHEISGRDHLVTYRDIVKPPFALMENNTNNVEFYTWKNGVLRHWFFEFDSSSHISIRNMIISKSVGDFSVFE